MYITEVKEKVEQILEQRNGVEIYFVLKKNESRIVRSVNIADELDTSDTTSEEMLNGFVTVIENTFSSYNDSDEVLNFHLLMKEKMLYTIMIWMNCQKKWK